nr:hypothetical protein [Burkholderia multivorans]
MWNLFYFNQTASAIPGVIQELIQAYHDGLLPTSKHDYPPSEATIARNKELHQLSEPKWAAQH